MVIFRRTLWVIGCEVSSPSIAMTNRGLASSIRGILCFLMYARSMKFLEDPESMSVLVCSVIPSIDVYQMGEWLDILR